MKRKDFQNVSVHIKYLDEMSVFDLQESLYTLHQAFVLFYENTHIPLSESNEMSPKVVSVSDGSVLIDIIVPVSCALLPILYDAIRDAFSAKKKYVVNVGQTRTAWTDKDNYKISKAVLAEYAVRQSKKSVDDFISALSLSHIYKKGSIRAKIQNTKQLMMENRMSNSLPLAPLKNYSQAHKIQFEQARKDLHI